MSSTGEPSALDAFLAAFSACKASEHKITVLTGAGLSTECGVPDFRSPDSPWRRYPPIPFKDFLADPLARAEAWRRKFAMDDIYAGARPGRGHRALATLAAQGIVGTVITQNIDGLHQAGGLDPGGLIELHGNGTYARCLSCETRFELSEARSHLADTGMALTCACGGFVKSATIAFGQTLRPEVIAAAMTAAEDCTHFLVVGSSLVVRPAAQLPLIAARRGALLAIVNREATPLDAVATHVVRGDAGDVLTRLACCLENNTSQVSRA